MKHRSGTATLAGRSNVGKSTLLNRLVGAKVAITSKKPQTTRTRLVGIQTLPAAQIAWVDTPGVHRARSLLNRRMVGSAEQSIDDADLVVLVLDAAAGLVGGDEAVAARLERRPWIIAVNKIDLVRPVALVPVLARIGERHPGVDVVPVSAATGRNVEELVRTVAARLPAGPRLYPEDELTDQTARAIVAEFIREQVFAATEGEIPYRTSVVVETFEEKSGVNVVAAAILVERDSQKRIVIGARGTMIREVGTRARLELERFFAKKFFLELFVKVRRDWTRSPRILDELGL